MNILIPHTWLNEHLDSEATPEQISEHLSLSGPSVEHIYRIADEPVYDIEITTNRVDSMSIRGIAREAAVILEQAGIDADLTEEPDYAVKIKEIDTTGRDLKHPLELPKVTNDPELINRTLCVVLRGVQHNKTPDWMAKRLEQIEQNVHDAVIDITNYITHELGHPCHAFDYDKIMALGGEIIIKEAEAGKPFTTLDGETYETVGGEIVFENPQGEIIDFPAIKGTANTAVDDNTQNILLWIESLDAKKVRFGSMTHAIRTVAAQLNEKNVDPNLADAVLVRGVELYRELCDAEIASHVHDDFPSKSKRDEVTVTQEKIDSYLGLHMEEDRILQILKDLGCEVAVSDGSYSITPPTYRQDLSIHVDIVEEIARIYGYHNLPSKLMTGPIPTNRQDHVDYAVEERIKRFLSDIGWQEIYSYSMISEPEAVASGHELDEHMKLENPLTMDHVYLRRSLVPSLHTALERNSQRDQLSMFEIANVYHPTGDSSTASLPNETLMITLSSNRPYREVRGDFEALLAQFYIQDVTITQDTPTTGTVIATAAHDETSVELGSVTIWDDITSFEISFEKLLPLVSGHPSYQPAPTTGFINEDFTFTIPAPRQVGRIIDSMLETDQLIYRVQLESMYEDNVTFRVQFHNSSQNISDEVVAPIRRKLVEKVSKEHDAAFVGSLE